MRALGGNQADRRRQGRPAFHPLATFRLGATRRIFIAKLLSALRKGRYRTADAVCAEQVIDPIDHGVEDLHFHTMNRGDLVFAICHLIGLRAKPKAAAAAA
jgi:hypothetical protein